MIRDGELRQNEPERHFEKTRFYCSIKRKRSKSGFSMSSINVFERGGVFLRGKNRHASAFLEPVYIQARADDR